MKKDYEKPEIEELKVKDTKGIDFFDSLDDDSGTPKKPIGKN